MTIQNYLEELKSFGRDDKTLVAYKQTLETIQGFIGKELVESTKGDIQKFIVEYSNNGYKNSTIKKYVNALNIYLEYYGYNKIKAVRYPVEVKEVKEVPTPDQALDMVEHGRNAQEKLRLALMFNQALRTCEVGTIKMSDIDFANKTLLVHGKQNKQRRIALLGNTLDLIKQVRKDIELKGCIDEEYLFGKKLSESAIKKTFYQVKEVASVDNIKPHDLRRMKVVDMVEKGVSVEDAALLLGHSGTNVTRKHYLVINEQRANDRIRKVMG